MMGGRNRLGIDVRAVRTQWPLVVNAITDSCRDVLIIAAFFEEGAALLDLNCGETLVSVPCFIDVHEQTGLAGSVPDFGAHRVLAIFDGRSSWLDTTLNLPIVGAQYLLHFGIV